MENNESNDLPVESPKNPNTKIILAIAVLILPILSLVFILQSDNSNKKIESTQAPIEDTSIDTIDKSSPLIEAQKPLSGVNEPAEQIPQKSYVLWHIITNSNQEFLQTQAYYGESPEGEESLADTLVRNRKFKHIQQFSVKMDKEYKIYDTKPLSRPGEILVMATYDDVMYALIVDLVALETKVLFSTIEHSDFTNASIATISANADIIRFNNGKCTNCAGGQSSTGIYRISNNSYLNIGQIAQFEWLAGANFRYKPVPEDCESYFTNYFSDDVPNLVCEQKLTNTEWITGSL